MTAFDLEIDGAGAESDDFVIQNLAQFREHFSGEVLEAFFHPGDSALRGRQSLR